MATAGFEFHGSLNGSTPVIKDFTLGEGTAYNKGDIVLMQSDGYVDKATASIGEITGVMMETVTAANATAGSTLAKVAIVTQQQIWKCSMDATTTTAVVGNTKTLDVADQNTIDADDTSNGSLILYDTGTDDEGNVLGYVIFSDCTFTNA